METRVTLAAARGTSFLRDERLSGMSDLALLIRRLLAAILLVALVSGLVGPIEPAGAIPPSNDDLAGARVLSGDLPIVAEGTLQESSKEPGEPDHAGNAGGRSIWFAWTATASGRVGIDTCSTGWGIDTLLAVYVGGSMAELTEVASNDDWGCQGAPGIFSRVIIDAVAGTEYRIAVDSFDGAESPGVTLTISDAPAPVNDDRADAVDISGSLPIAVEGSNVGATMEDDEPDGFWPGGASVWYRWTATDDVAVQVDTCSAAFPSLLNVYGEGTDGLVPVATNREGCRPQGSAVAFSAQAGTTYLIAVDGTNAAQGPFTLRIGPAVRPGNDAVDEAEVLGGTLPIVVEGSNVGATAEPGEPAHGGLPTGTSVWYAWTPEVSTRVEINTCETSGVDTIVAVYTGSTVGDLALLAVDDDGCTPPASRVALDVTAGTTYLIAVDGYAAGQGLFQLSLGDAGIRPANDAFADAVVLGGPLPITVTGDTRQATREPGEARHGTIDVGLGGTIWYRWTPEASATVTLDTCSDATSYGYSLVAVHTGEGLDSLQVVEADAGECMIPGGRLTLDAVAGVTYHIAVAASVLSGSGGDVALEIREGPPANDNLASAEVLDGPLPITRAGTTAEATLEMREPDEHGNTYLVGWPTTWYSWEADRNGRVTADLCGSAIDASLDVFTGSTYDDLVAVARSEGGCGAQAQVTFEAVAGTRYLIRVFGEWNGIRQGPYALTLAEALPTPLGDAFADPQVLPARLPATAVATNVGAGAEPGETHGGHPARASLWWTWTAPRSGAVLLDTCGSAFDTNLFVYAGATLAELVPLAADDDSCGNSQSSVRLAAQAGTTYRIAVDGRRGDEGAVQLTARWAQTPANDDFANARPAPAGLPVVVRGTTADASLEPGERPEPEGIGYAGGLSVWYSWTPSSSAEVVVDTCGSASEAIPSVWTGATVAATQHVAFHSVAVCENGTSFRFTATAGTRYLLAVDTFDRDHQGAFVLRIRRPSAPSNDDFAAARQLGGRLPIEVRGTNVDATREDLDPTPGAVWYRWTATNADPVVVETCDSDISAFVEVFTGEELLDLLPVGHEGDPSEPRWGCGAVWNAPGPLGSGYRFTPVPGTTYHIAVWGGAQGRFRLEVRRPMPPANDDFAAAEVLGPRLPAVGRADASDATPEPGDDYERASVWFAWTPTRSETVVADSCGSDGDAVLSVFTGPSLDEAQLVGTDGDRCALGGRVTFDAVAGTTYRIRLADDVSGGPVELRIRRPDPPANDDVADAVRMHRSGGSVRGSTVDATAEPGEPVHGGRGERASIWYEWTPRASGLVAIDTCGSEIATAIAVYTGDDLAGLRHVASDDSGACGSASLVVFPAVAGTTYRIAVHGTGSSNAVGSDETEGNVRLTVRPQA